MATGGVGILKTLGILPATETQGQDQSGDLERVGDDCRAEGQDGHSIFSAIVTADARTKFYGVR